MGEETAFENGQISDFQGLATLTLDRVVLHTIMHHSSTSAYTANFIEIEETFCGRTDVRTGGRTFYTYCIRSTWRVDLTSSWSPHSNERHNVKHAEHRHGFCIL